MDNRGPFVTLAAVVGLALVLFGVNMTSARGPAATPGSAATPPASAVGTPGTAETTATGDATATGEATATAPASPTPRAAAAIQQAAYAGRTSGNEATVAIAVKAGKAVAYVCDGKRTEAWLQGTVTGRELALRGKGGSLTGSVRGSAVFGTVRVGGASWPYSAQAAKRPAGLYRANAAVRGVQYRIGWIVLQDGRQVGISAQDGARAPAPPLNPAAGAVTIDGMRVPVRSVSGEESLPS